MPNRIPDPRPWQFIVGGIVGLPGIVILVHMSLHEGHHPSQAWWVGGFLLMCGLAVTVPPIAKMIWHEARNSFGFLQDVEEDPSDEE